MASVKDRSINYDYNNPMKTFNLAMDLLFAGHEEDSEGKHPFEDEEDKGCAEYHFKKDMGEI